MTTYTDIPDASLDTGKPIRSIDGTSLRDNPIAITEGSPGAPRNQPGSMRDYVAAITVRIFEIDATTTDSSYQKRSEIFSGRGGSLRITMDGTKTAAGTAHMRIYVNGVAVGTQLSVLGDGGTYTLTEDISFAQGSFIQCFGRTDDGVLSMKMRVYASSGSIYDAVKTFGDF